MQAHLLGSLSDVGYLLTTIQRNQTLLQQLTVHKLPEPGVGYTVHARLLGGWQAVARICHQLARRVDVLRVSCRREHDNQLIDSDDA